MFAYTKHSNKINPINVRADTFPKAFFVYHSAKKLIAAELNASLRFCRWNYVKFIPKKY